MATEKKSEQALKKKQQAKFEQSLGNDYDKIAPGKGLVNYSLARKLEKEADDLLTLKEPAQMTKGNEALPISNCSHGIVETLKDPDLINIEASQSRIELADKADILCMAVDAAESIDAKNSIEKMLAHQMAACHKYAMTLLEKTHDNRNTMDVQRLINASARLMNAYQQRHTNLVKTAHWR